MQCAMFFVSESGVGERVVLGMERVGKERGGYYRIHKFADTTLNRWRRFGLAVVGVVGVGGRLGTFVRRIGIGRR